MLYGKGSYRSSPWFLRLRGLGLMVALLGAGLFIGKQSSIDASDNLLINGGFEEMDGNLPEGWTLDPRLKSKGEVRVSTSTKASGQQALELNPNRRNTDEGNLFALAQLKRVEG